MINNTKEYCCSEIVRLIDNEYIYKTGNYWRCGFYNIKLIKEETNCEWQTLNTIIYICPFCGVKLKK